MGRWSQRNLRGGGGPRPTTALISMVTAVDQGAGEVTITYTGNIVPGAFDPADFHDLDTGEEGIDFTGTADNIGHLTLNAATAPGHELRYDGVVAGVLAPQTIVVT